MSYESMMAKKPTFLGVLQKSSVMVITVVFILACICLLVLAVYNIVREEEKRKLTVYLLGITFLVMMAISNMIVEYRMEIERWESGEIREYIEGLGEYEEYELSKVEPWLLNRDIRDYASVSFVVDHEMVTKKAEVRFYDDVTEPYVIYYRLDRDIETGLFGSYFYEGGTYFVELRLPKDYKI